MFQLMSDLHLEFDKKEPFVPTQTDASLIVIAGDLHLKQHGIDWLLTYFANKPVIYVPGNHEHYGGSFGHTTRKLREKAQGTNVHVLNRSVFEHEGVRYLGATLWSDFKITGNEPLAKVEAYNKMTDYKKIRTESYSKIRPHHWQAEHIADYIFLREELAKPYAGKTVVVTHFAPSEQSLEAKYNGTEDHHLQATYASNMEHLLPFCSIWCHGHVHASKDYQLNGARIVCNPRGYNCGELNPEFNPALVITC